MWTVHRRQIGITTRTELQRVNESTTYVFSVHLRNYGGTRRRRVEVETWVEGPGIRVTEGTSLRGPVITTIKTREKDMRMDVVSITPTITVVIVFTEIKLLVVSLVLHTDTRVWTGPIVRLTIGTNTVRVEVFELTPVVQPTVPSITSRPRRTILFTQRKVPLSVLRCRRSNGFSSLHLGFHRLELVKF